MQKPQRIRGLHTRIVHALCGCFRCWSNLNIKARANELLSRYIGNRCSRRTALAIVIDSLFLSLSLSSLPCSHVGYATAIPKTCLSNQNARSEKHGVAGVPRGACSTRCDVRAYLAVCEDADIVSVDGGGHEVPGVLEDVDLVVALFFRSRPYL